MKLIALRSVDSLEESDHDFLSDTDLDCFFVLFCFVFVPFLVFICSLGTTCGVPSSFIILKRRQTSLRLKTRKLGNSQEDNLDG